MGALSDVREVLADSRIVAVASDTPSTAAEQWATVLEVAAEQHATATRDAQQWPEAARARVVERVARATRIAEAAKAPVLLAQERSGTWRRPGMRSFEAHRAAQEREDLSTARREITTARTLEELEGGLDALALGQITPSHAQRLRAIADKSTPEQRSFLLTGEGAARVRDLAREHDPGQFARKVEELATSRHPAEVQDAHEVIRAKRFLRLSHSQGGTRIEGFLDAVAGHRFRLAVEAASSRPGKDDNRTAGQRNADALEAIAGAILEEGALAPSRNVPTQVMITMTEDTFLSARSHLARATHRRADEGQRQDDTDTLMPFPRVRAQDGPLLPPADLGKLLCGSSIGRLVLDADSVPLNAGRSQRTFKNTLRRAVELRDQHCAWPECHQVARYCKVHHLDWWDADHGETDVTRGILVCEFHHHELHTHDLDLVPQGASPPGPAPGDAIREVIPIPDEGKLRSPLPGDVDYRPPRYELVPRSRTADERSARLARRMRARRDERLAARAG